MTVNRTKTYAEAAKMSAKKTFPDSQSMLNDPNIDSAANLDASLQFRDDREAYNKRVRILAAKSVEDM